MIIVSIVRNHANSRIILRMDNVASPILHKAANWRVLHLGYIHRTHKPTTMHLADCSIAAKVILVCTRREGDPRAAPFIVTL